MGLFTDIVLPERDLVVVLPVPQMAQHGERCRQAYCQRQADRDKHPT